MYKPNTKILGTLNNNKNEKIFLQKKLSMVYFLKKHSEKAEKCIQKGLNNIK